jgi:hypothetical protein
MLHTLKLLTISLLLLLMSSCSVVEGIFKAGMGVGIFVVVAIVGLALFLILKLSKNKKP